MRRVVALVLAGILASSAQAASPRCFMPREIEADQAIQFQTELMVLSDTCRTNSYSDFARRNRATIGAYQHELVGYFRRGGERRAEDALDSYLTHLANENSLRNGQQPLVRLCQDGADFMSRADRLRSEEFQRLAAERASERRNLYRHCSE